MTTNGRLTERRIRLRRQDYLTYRYLWANIERAVATAKARAASRPLWVLDVGCGHKPYRDLFEDCVHIGVDRTTDDANPDAISDATRLAIQEERFDIVFASQVIEHVPHPIAMVTEVYRVLKPGGFLILTGPFWWPIHEEPYDYHRFTKHGFENLLREAGFTEFEITPDGGDWAQFFLSVSLRLGGRLLVPLRVASNALGAALDRWRPSYRLPANYTILARKQQLAPDSAPGDQQRLIHRLDVDGD